MLSDNKRKSLGRGLGALLGDDLEILEGRASKAEDKKIDINLLYPSKYQPRVDFNQEALEALSQSIKEKGVLQPLLVRQDIDGKYEIIAGERRYRASKMAGLTEVPVVIKDMNNQEVLEVALVENLLRENLSIIEEAEGLQRLVDEFSHTQEALSQIIGKSRSYVANTIRLLSLPDSVQQMIKDNLLTAGHIRPFIGYENVEEIAKKIVSKGLNVRQAEALAVKQKEEQTNKTSKQKNVDITEIEERLNKRLSLKVSISTSKSGGGKVSLNYKDIFELDKIIDILEQRNKISESGNAKFTIDIVD